MCVFSHFYPENIAKGKNFRIDTRNKSMDLFPSKILLTEKNYLEFKQNYSETLKIVQIKLSK